MLGPPTVAGRAVVLPPGQLAAVVGCSQDVGVTVTVDIGAEDCPRPNEVAVDGVRCPAAVTGRSIVFPPADVIPALTGTHDVRVTVPIHIHRIHRPRPEVIAVDGVFGPSTIARAPIVGPPRDLAGTHRGAQDVHVTIEIDVCRADAERQVERCSDDVFGPWTIAGRSVVLPPADLTIPRGRRRQVQVAIAIHVGGDQGVGAVARGTHRMLGPSAVDRRAIVLEPNDVVVVEPGDCGVDVAIAVKIRPDHSDPDRVGHLEDRMGGPSPIEG